MLWRIAWLSAFNADLAGVLGPARVMAARAQLLGEPAVLFEGKVNFKLLGGAGFEAHQDVHSGWGRYAAFHRMLMVCIEATTVANGCLELAPESHVHGVISEMWTPLADRVPGDAYVACPTAVGDVVFFDSFVAHLPAPNAARHPRRVF